MNAAFDAIVIGSGQAGPSLAVRLANAGMQVAIVERDHFGGTCVNDGCMPTKTLVASAYAAHIARNAAAYGVLVNGSVSVDMKRVKARKDEVVQRSAGNVERWLKSTPGLTVVRGHARFLSPRTLEVAGKALRAERIFLNVGGRALVPTISGIEQVPYYTNSTFMDVDFLPRHLLVVGGSYIGLEFAQMYRRFGSQVTVIEKFPKLIGREDDDVSSAVLQIMRNEGIAVELGAECMSFAKDGRDVAVSLDCASGTRIVRASHILLAVGRVPNTDDLGLDRAGIETDTKGFIVVDEHLRTNVPGIWALGDCNGRGAFTHTSYNDYEIVADHLFDGATRSVDTRINAYALFIDPPLGRVGMTDTEIRRSRRRALTATRPMTRVGRAVEKGETQGFMKISVDAESKQILGAAILGVGGDEAIHSVLDVMYSGAPYTTLQRAVNIHPTVSELIPTLLGELGPLD
jgi:pyruvate/2-oxoglutarate dehydrogenase complex dihydrolipoamide dehydrogenase (E3) component